MQILAIDLGKFKSVACVYETNTGEHHFSTIVTSPAEMHDLLSALQPDRLVIEIGSAAGWVKDMAREMQIETQVANPNHEAWRWKIRGLETAVARGHLTKSEQIEVFLAIGEEYHASQWRRVAVRTATITFAVSILGFIAWWWLHQRHRGALVKIQRRQAERAEP